MKKYIVPFSLMFLFFSCKKDCEPPVQAIPLLLPAVQKIREAANRNWQPDNKFLEKIEIDFSEPLKKEFLNFETDSNIVVTCRIKFKAKSEEILLPYSIVNAAGEQQTYFYTTQKDKLVLLRYNSGSSPALLTESISLNFTKIK